MSREDEEDDGGGRKQEEKERWWCHRGEQGCLMVLPSPTNEHIAHDHFPFTTQDLPRLVERCVEAFTNLVQLHQRYNFNIIVANSTFFLCHGVSTRREDLHKTVSQNWLA